MFAMACQPTAPVEPARAITLDRCVPLPPARSALLGGVVGEPSVMKPAAKVRRDIELIEPPLVAGKVSVGEELSAPLAACPGVEELPVCRARPQARGLRAPARRRGTAWLRSPRPAPGLARRCRRQ